MHAHPQCKKEGAAERGVVSSFVHAMLRSGGQLLSERIRTVVKPYFGHDFSIKIAIEP